MSQSTTRNQRQTIQVIDSVTKVPFIVQGNSSTGSINVAITSGGGAGTQYSSGTTTPSPVIGNALIYDNGGTLQDVSAANPLPVSATISTAGLATSALQTSGNASLTTIATNLPAQGQALATGSLPVVLTAAQLTTLTPPAAITGYSTSANQTNGSQITQVSNFPSSQTISGNVGLLAGSNIIGSVDVNDGVGNKINSTSNALNVYVTNSSTSSTATTSGDITTIAGAPTATVADGVQLISIAGPTGDPIDTFGNALQVNSRGLITDPNTNIIANVVAGDPGYSGVATASATKTITFTTSASGAQTLLANTNVEGYSWMEVIYNSVGTGLTLTGGQFSTTSGGTYINSATFGAGTGPFNQSLSNGNNTIYQGPVLGNFFQIAVSALTSGTFAGTVILHASPLPIATVAASQNGAWVIGSGSNLIGQVGGYSNGSTGTITTSSSSIVSGTQTGSGGFTQIGISGTYSGVQFGITTSNDAGITFYNVPVYDATANQWLIPGATITPGTNATRMYYVPTPAQGQIKILASAYTNGTASIRTMIGGNTSPGSTMSQIMDSAGNARGANVDASNNLMVNIGNIATMSIVQTNTQQVGGTDWQLASEGMPFVALSGPTGDPLDTFGNILKVAVSSPVQSVLVNSPLVGQSKIATTGTSLSLNSGTSQVLTNGLIITASSANAASIAIGASGVTNTGGGTGSGYLLAPGASVSFAIANTNQIYINGTSGDFVSWAGS